MCSTRRIQYKGSLPFRYSYELYDSIQAYVQNLILCIPLQLCTTHLYSGCVGTECLTSRTALPLGALGANCAHSSCPCCSTCTERDALGTVPYCGALCVTYGAPHYLAAIISYASPSTIRSDLALSSPLSCHVMSSHTISHHITSHHGMCCI